MEKLNSSQKSKGTKLAHFGGLYIKDIEMYKLAEFRKKLEQKKPSSWERVGSYSKLRLSIIQKERSSCNATGKRFFGLMRCQHCFNGYTQHIGSHIEERNDDIKPIRDMMKRVNEMYNKPRQCGVFLYLALRCIITIQSLKGWNHGDYNHSGGWKRNTFSKLLY